MMYFIFFIFVGMITLLGIGCAVVVVVMSDTKEDRLIALMACAYGISLMIVLAPLMEMRRECIIQDPKIELCAKVLEATGL